MSRPVPNLHGTGTRAHWDLSYPCCGLPAAVNIQSLERVAEMVAAHTCLTAKPAAKHHPTPAERSLRTEARRWIYQATHDKSQERRRRAAVLLCDALSERYDVVGGSDLFGQLAEWLGGREPVPDKEVHLGTAQPDGVVKAHPDPSEDNWPF